MQIVINKKQEENNQKENIIQNFIKQNMKLYLANLINFSNKNMVKRKHIMQKKKEMI